MCHSEEPMHTHSLYVDPPGAYGRAFTNLVYGDQRVSLILNRPERLRPAYVKRVGRRLKARHDRRTKRYQKAKDKTSNAVSEFNMSLAVNNT